MSYYTPQGLGTAPSPYAGQGSFQMVPEFSGQSMGAPSPLAPAGSAAPGMPPSAGMVAGITGLAQLGTAIANDFARREQNKALENYKARVRAEAERSRVSQMDDARQAMERNRVKARVANAQINQQALMRRGAAMVKAGVTGVGGTTAEQLIQADELRQAKALAGVEVQLEMSGMAQAERNRAIHHQERQRLLQLTSMNPQQSTLGADLVNIGTQYASTYMQMQGAQQRGVNQAIQATA